MWTPTRISQAKLPNKPSSAYAQYMQDPQPVRMSG